LKNSFRTTVLQPLSLLLFLSNSSLALTIENSSQAVDIAGKQRMFTQKMLKEYSMIGMNNNFGNSVKNLENLIISFDKHLELLHGYTKNRDIQKSITKAKDLWIPIKQRLKHPPKKEYVVDLQKDLEKLLEASDNTTKLFEKESGDNREEIINIAGRQRMLSQKMASLYMLKVWGIKDQEFKKKMNETMALFKSSLVKLKVSKLNNEKTTVLLNKVEKSFLFFEIMNRSTLRFIPTLIYKKSNDILENMEAVTKSYVLEKNNR